MSRIGKKLIKIPQEIQINIEQNHISVSGKNGKIEKSFLDIVKFEKIDDVISISRLNDEKFTKSYHGLTRALLENMIQGVYTKFKKILIAEGVGYKFQLDKNNLTLNMGFTHPVQFSVPEGLAVKLESPTKLVIEGIDKEKVGLFAANLRQVRPPEPYKGKGIRYEGEKIIRKAGKTGK
jgi:large subunit ribosomal protein L6